MFGLRKNEDGDIEGVRDPFNVSSEEASSSHSETQNLMVSPQYSAEPGLLGLLESPSPFASSPALMPGLEPGSLPSYGLTGVLTLPEPNRPNEMPVLPPSLPLPEMTLDADLDMKMEADFSPHDFKPYLCKTACGLIILFNPAGEKTAAIEPAILQTLVGYNHKNAENPFEVMWLTGGTANSVHYAIFHPQREQNLFSQLLAENEALIAKISEFFKFIGISLEQITHSLNVGEEGLLKHLLIKKTSRKVQTLPTTSTSAAPPPLFTPFARPASSLGQIPVAAQQPIAKLTGKPPVIKSVTVKLEGTLVWSALAVPISVKTGISTPESSRSISPSLPIASSSQPKVARVQLPDYNSIRHIRYSQKMKMFFISYGKGDHSDNIKTLFFRAFPTSTRDSQKQKICLIPRGGVMRLYHKQTGQPLAPSEVNRFIKDEYLEAFNNKNETEITIKELMKRTASAGEEQALAKLQPHGNTGFKVNTSGPRKQKTPDPQPKKKQKTKKSEEKSFAPALPLVKIENIEPVVKTEQKEQQQEQDLTQFLCLRKERQISSDRQLALKLSEDDRKARTKRGAQAKKRKMVDTDSETESEVESDSNSSASDMETSSAASSAASSSDRDGSSSPSPSRSVSPAPSAVDHLFKGVTRSLTPEPSAKWQKFTTPKEEKTKKENLSLEQHPTPPAQQGAEFDWSRYWDTQAADSDSDTEDDVVRTNPSLAAKLG